jgi:4-hydroxy-3-polyprenylbenzoate decarboxylase
LKGKEKIVLAITGASGSVYAKMLISEIKNRSDKYDLSLVFSQTAKEVWKYELGEDVNYTGINAYEDSDFFAPFASGSAAYDKMIICPCSMGTLGRIASGTSDNLIARAADVFLKERKKLILVLREAPLNLIHIENMKLLTLAGAICMPASPSFYSLPNNKEDVLKSVTDRILDLAGIENNSFKWKNK